MDFLAKHKEKLKKIAIYVIVIIGFAFFIAILMNFDSDESRHERNAEIMQEEIEAGLVQADLLADNANMTLAGTTSTARTLIYSVNDSECGFTLYLVSNNAGLNQRVSISGERIPGIIASAPAGFKQISGSIGNNLEQVPEVCRYLDLKRGIVIYYLDWYSSSCSFDLFEK